jgi:hypothetical protein
VSEVVVVTGASGGVRAQRPANLWEPIGVDEGAQRRFDDGEAKARSPHLCVSRHRRALAAAALAASVVAAGVRDR